MRSQLNVRNPHTSLAHQPRTHSPLADWLIGYAPNRHACARTLSLFRPLCEYALTLYTYRCICHTRVYTNSNCQSINLLARPAFRLRASEEKRHLTRNCLAKFATRIKCYLIAREWLRSAVHTHTHTHNVMFIYVLLYSDQLDISKRRKL